MPKRIEDWIRENGVWNGQLKVTADTMGKKKKKIECRKAADDTGDDFFDKEQAVGKDM